MEIGPILGYLEPRGILICNPTQAFHASCRLHVASSIALSLKAQGVQKAFRGDDLVTCLLSPVAQTTLGFRGQPSVTQGKRPLNCRHLGSQVGLLWGANVLPLDQYTRSTCVLHGHLGLSVFS